MLAHKRHFLANSPFQIYVFKSIFLAVGIFEPDMLELKFIFVIITLFRRDSALVLFVGNIKKVKIFLAESRRYFQQSERSDTPADIFSKYSAKAITSPGDNIPLAALMTAKPYISAFVRILTT